MIGRDYPEPQILDPFADEDELEQELRSSWEPRSLAMLAEQASEPPAATLLPVQGARGLLYPERTHLAYSEPGLGKSWLIAAAIYETLRRDITATAALLDFEDSADLWAVRFRQLGVPAEELRRITYLAPREPMPEQFAVHRITEHGPAIVALDGLTGFYQLHGLDPDSSTDTNRAFGWIDQASRNGAAVLLTDHVTKSRDGRRFPIGSQHKLARITGAAYRLDPLGEAPLFRRHGSGVVQLKVTKDRPGGIPVGLEQQAAVLTLDDRREPAVLGLRPGEGWR